MGKSCEFDAIQGHIKKSCLKNQETEMFLEFLEKVRVYN